MSTIQKSPAVLRSQPVRPVAAFTPAAAPQLAAKAQAKPPASGLPVFETTADYKRFVESSEVRNLPAARTALAAAKQALTEANQALASRQQALGQPGLVAAVKGAEQALETTTYPLRGKAAELRHEADGLTGEITRVANGIEKAQQQIASAEGNKSARSRDVWFGDNKSYSGWDAAADVLGSIGDAGTIKSAKGQIQRLVSEKVKLETKMSTLTAQAAAYEIQKGDPAAIDAASAKLKQAQDTLASVEGQLDPEKRRVSAAQGGVSSAEGKVKGLEVLKADLQDYSARFGFVTRTKLTFSDFGWKKDLDAFWKAKGF